MDAAPMPCTSPCLNLLCPWLEEVRRDLRAALHTLCWKSCQSTHVPHCPGTKCPAQLPTGCGCMPLYLCCCCYPHGSGPIGGGGGQGEAQETYGL